MDVGIYISFVVSLFHFWRVTLHRRIVKISGGSLISIHRYLDVRGISNGVGPVIWPSSYGPTERDEAYKTFSLSGWAGRSGHDAPMIALDALLGAGSDWEELMSRAGFHGGQRFKQDNVHVLSYIMTGRSCPNQTFNYYYLWGLF